MPPHGAPASIAPSLDTTKKGVGTATSANGTLATPNGVPNGIPNGTTTPINPTVVPPALLSRFHFTFLIRHPRSSIPSYYRCCLPPLAELTGFSEFLPSEAGYVELRQLFDYLRAVGQVRSSSSAPSDSEPIPEICVVDADDLLDDPEGIIRAYCAKVGLDFHPDMLVWDTKEDEEQARHAFEKWHGFHEDAIDSRSLRKRVHVSVSSELWGEGRWWGGRSWLIWRVLRKKQKTKSEEDEDKVWEEKFGKQGKDLIRKTVRECVGDYEYLREFRLKPLEG